MSDRKVTSTGKNNDKDITRLCNSPEPWSPRNKEDAIRDIKNRIHTYYVLLKDKGRVDIHVVPGKEGDYLRTDRDKTTKNNLAGLPDC